jgi:arabinofuranan 3-O-arabinosyltransferase
MGRGTESGTNFRWRTRGGQAFFTDGRATWFKLQSMFGLVRFFGGSEPLAWTLQWMMSGTVVIALVMAWRSRLPYALKAAALATATLPVTPYLFLYDEIVLAIPVALLVRIGPADGFAEYELPALGCVALLLLSFPWVGAPVSLGATLIVAMLIVRRAGGPRTTMMSNMSTL